VSIAFLLTTLAVVATPGTGVLYTLAAALARGYRAGMVAAVGCTLGIVPHMVAAITGLAALLHASALAFQVLKYAGVAYLLFMAWNTLRAKGALHVDEESSPRSARRVIVSGVLINILNPKLTIFFFAFLPQFVPTGEPRRAGAHAAAERSLHGGDVRRFRGLRALRRRRARSGRLPAPGDGLDPARLRRRVRRVERPAGARRALKSLSARCGSRDGGRACARPDGPPSRRR
jgi:threonine/homoserine/homoserine lactone efflux protein